MRSNESSQVFVAVLIVIVAALYVVATQPAQAQTYTVFHNFGLVSVGDGGDGGFPNGDMIQDPEGNLIGTTNWDASVFKLDPSGAVTTLTQSTCDNSGCKPVAGLFRDPEGNLYGTSTGGGDTCGNVFKLDTAGTLTFLHRFVLCGAGGGGPDSTLVSINGELYGTTERGGTPGCYAGGGCGTIFKISKSGEAKVLYRFTGGADGADPQSLIRDALGNLYGVAYQGGNGFGTVFRFDAAGVFRVLHTFVGADGAYPSGRLTRDANDNIHGATQGGGTCCGVVFRLDANGNETILHNFVGHEGGSRPSAGVLDVGGVLYGTTQGGGDLHCYLSSVGGCGVLYQISRTGQYTVLHRFAGQPTDGSYPLYGGLTLGADGSIYGATRKGGAGTDCGSNNGCGVVFKYTP